MSMFLFFYAFNMNDCTKIYPYIIIYEMWGLFWVCQIDSFMYKICSSRIKVTPKAVLEQLHLFQILISAHPKWG